MGGVRERAGGAVAAGCCLLAMVATSALAGGARAGETFMATGTRRVATLIGYGQPMLRAQAPPSIASADAGGDILWGADIGLPVTIEADPDGSGTRPVTFFFFGDTDLLDHARLVSTKWVYPYQAAAGELAAPYGVIQGDAVAYSLDDSPAGGIALSHVLRNREPGDAAPVCGAVRDDGFRAMYVPGVHPDRCASGIKHGKDIDWRFLTPTGAWAMDSTLFVMIADQTPYGGIPQATSYLAASTDGGLTWEALQSGAPFSSADNSGHPFSKFVHVDAIAVDAADYQDLQRSGPCGLPLPPGTDTRGFLLFGAGLWNQTDVYLAFVPRQELADAVADRSHVIKVWYFSGVSGGGCWSTSQADAVPVVATLDNRAFVPLEAACGNRILQDSGGAGYVSVTRLSGKLGKTSFDRLVMFFDSDYWVCKVGAPDPCCGGTPVENGTMCEGSTDAYQDFLVEGNAGIVMITGDPWRPWLWNVVLDPGADPASVAPAAVRGLRPETIPPDPAADWLGAGPECTTVMSGRDVISGYAPLIVDRFAGPAPDGRGFEVYFLVSRWGTRVSENDPASPEEGYHYMVDLFRTEIVPKPAPRTAGRASPADPGRFRKLRAP